MKICFPNFSLHLFVDVEFIFGLSAAEPTDFPHSSGAIAQTRLNDKLSTR
jgi:hypothetical protein